MQALMCHKKVIFSHSLLGTGYCPVSTPLSFLEEQPVSQSRGFSLPLDLLSSYYELTPMLYGGLGDLKISAVASRPWLGIPMSGNQNRKTILISNNNPVRHLVHGI